MNAKLILSETSTQLSAIQKDGSNAADVLHAFSSIRKDWQSNTELDKADWIILLEILKERRNLFLSCSCGMGAIYEKSISNWGLFWKGN